jgi:predicted RecA/RadA family phage recombinase
MGVIIDTGVNGISMECAAEAIYEGKCYMYSSGNLTVCTADHDECVAVALDSTINQSTGGALTLTAGDGASFALIGSGMIVGVCSGITETWAKGAKVYLHDTVDGAVTSSSSSSVCIGTFMGKPGLVTAASLEIIPVMLNKAPGALS